VGVIVFIKFVGEPGWVARLITGIINGVGDTLFTAFTPDAEHYVHSVDHIEDAHAAGPRGGATAAVRTSGLPIVRFSPKPSDEDIDDLVAEAEVAARTEGHELVGAVAAASPPAGPVGGAPIGGAAAQPPARHLGGGLGGSALVPSGAAGVRPTRAPPGGSAATAVAANIGGMVWIVDDLCSDKCGDIVAPEFVLPNSVMYRLSAPRDPRRAYAVIGLLGGGTTVAVSEYPAHCVPRYFEDKVASPDFLFNVRRYGGAPAAAGVGHSPERPLNGSVTHAWYGVLDDVGNLLKLDTISADEVDKFTNVGDVGVATLKDGRGIGVLWSLRSIEGVTSLKHKLVAGAQALGDDVGPKLEDSDDIRTFPLKKDARDKRYVSFKEGVDRLKERVFDDWPIEGPMTFLWVVHFIAQTFGTPTAFFQRFCADGKLSAVDPGIVTLEVLCKIIQCSIEYDQVNGAGLACLELACRFLQMIQMRYREKFLGNSAAGGKKGANIQNRDDCDLHLFMGSSTTRGRLAIAPALQEWVANRQHDEALIYKERRKLMEERRHLAAAGKGTEEPKDSV
jgi:hypothetical protein